MMRLFASAVYVRIEYMYGVLILTKDMDKAPWR